MVIKAQNRETGEVSGDHSVFPDLMLFPPVLERSGLHSRVFSEVSICIRPLVCTTEFHTHTK
jgi:hypothetical protein